MSVDLYFDMIGRKTAALIAASIEAGALLATDDDAISPATGIRLGAGLAFQVNDDLLGIWGPEQAGRADRHRPPQEDAAGDLRLQERRRRGPRAPRRALPRPRRRRARSPRSWRSSSEHGARDFTATQRYRDEALAELDAAY